MIVTIKSLNEIQPYLNANHRVAIFVSGGNGCGKCRMESTKANLKLVQEAIQKLNIPFLLINYDNLDDMDEFPLILKQLNIVAYPAYICVLDGKVIGNRSGVGMAEQTIEWFKTCFNY